MKPMKADDPEPLSNQEVGQTTAWLLSQQRPSGEIPWSAEGKMDPWDHIHSAMSLAAMGHRTEAKAAMRFMARTQDPNGGWAAERKGGKVSRITQETNHAAYFATGAWFLHCHQPDSNFLVEMWPTLETAIDLVVSLQLPSGGFAWAVKNGKVWKAPLLTGSASIHGSLVCAVRVAERLGYSRPGWDKARQLCAHVLRHNLGVFSDTDLKEKPGRHSMDWYYPVLGGAVRGNAARSRLLDPGQTGAFIEEGIGCRCVRDKPWYTIAETCELVLALDACGLTQRARQILSWTRHQRNEDGAYWTGKTHPAGIIFPAGERTTWTAAAVLIATSALHRSTSTRDFFRMLDGQDLDRLPVRDERPAARSYDELPPPAAE